MTRVNMQDFVKECRLSPNSIRYYIDTGQLPIGLRMVGPTGKPRYYLFREMIDECIRNGKLALLEGGKGK